MISKLHHVVYLISSDTETKESWKNHPQQRTEPPSSFLSMSAYQGNLLGLNAICSLCRRSQKLQSHLPDIKACYYLRPAQLNGLIRNHPATVVALPFL